MKIQLTRVKPREVVAFWDESQKKLYLPAKPSDKDASVYYIDSDGCVVKSEGDSWASIRGGSSSSRTPIYEDEPFTLVI